MSHQYRVEAHDGSSWAFGIRFDPDKRIPVFCDLDSAALGTRTEAEDLLRWAQGVTGGSLRINRVPAHGR